MHSFKSRILECIGEQKPTAWGQMIGLNLGVIDRIFRQGKIPTAKHLITISRALGVSIDWLLTGSGETNYIKKKDADTEPFTLEEKKYVKKLLRILRSNDALMRNAIIPNLNAFDGRLITGEHPEKKRRAGNDD